MPHGTRPMALYLPLHQGQVLARHREMQGRGSTSLGKARICFILAVLNALVTQELMTAFYLLWVLHTCCAALGFLSCEGHCR